MKMANLNPEKTDLNLFCKTILTLVMKAKPISSAATVSPSLLKPFSRKKYGTSTTNLIS